MRGRRSSLAPGELAGAYEQLAGFGLSAAQIAKQTATKRAEVTAGLAVAGSELARKATERWDFLTLDQAAALAEFEDDTEATKALVAGAKEGQFEHVVQRLRDDRDEAQALAEVAAELTAAGATVIERPGYNSPILRLDRLSHDGVEITEQSHQDCAGHAAFVATEYSWDYTNDDRPVQVEQRGPVWVCTDPAANGHTDRWNQRSTPAGETVDDQEQAAQRRRVLAGNKAWRSATTVRREWLQSFTARKTPPEGAERFLIAALLHGDDCLRRAMEAGCNHRRLRVLLGMAEDDEAKTYGAGREHIAQLVEQTTTATPKRAVQLAVALVLAAWEDQTGPHTWRNPDERGRRYLGALAGWGYPLSEIEAPIVATEETAD